MNNLLLLVSVILTFSLLVASKKLFGAEGVIGFMGLATILANIFVCKSVDLLGQSATLGNVMFASNFLATDILTECYGVKKAKEGVMFAIFCAMVYLACTQVSLLYAPNEFDTVNESMKAIFSFAPRITIASVAMFALSNVADVGLYEAMRKKTSGKYMWLRNNVATIICNGAENFLFYAIAFGFTEGFSFSVIVSMAISATIIEVVVALLDTPFLYIATKEKGYGKTKNRNQKRTV